MIETLEPPVDRSGSPIGSAFLRDAINARLAELRHECAVAREIKRTHRRCHWGWWPTAERERQAALIKDTDAIRAAEQSLRDFIGEHRSLMGSDWIGNEHGRLCCASYLGGLPIDQHYCALPEGHEGFHEGAGEEGRGGAWPQGVHNGTEWHRLRDSCAHPCWNGGQLVCSVCGAVKTDNAPY